MSTPFLDLPSSEPERLLPYGWNASLAGDFADLGLPDHQPARVLRAERTACEAITPDGIARVDLVGAHSANQASPTTGDWIAVTPPEPGQARRLAALLPRRTELHRGGSGGASRVQVLAANVDTVFVAVSLSSALRHARTERFLSLAWSSGATPVLVATKADLCPDPDAALEELREVALGIELVSTSAATGEGMERLRSLAVGTVALLGPSGAGKSTLGNALLGEELLDTGAIREADGRGRHTTAWRELLPLPGGGVLLDTPGLRSVGMSGDEEGLERTFGDVEELALGCRFADCEHRTEPGCAVLAAIDEGALSERRLASYRKLLRENAWQASRTDALLRQEIGAKWKSMAKSNRAMKREIKRRDTGR